MQNTSGFFKVLFLLVALLGANASFGQCPEITNVTYNPADGSFLCPGDPITIDIEGVNLPQGSIDWYIEPATGNPNFNPYNGEGMLIGSSGITPDGSEIDICDPCPELVAIMIDACNGNNGTGSEYDNEFLMISSGGGISSAGQIQIDLASQNNVEFGGIPGANNDINFGNDPCGFLNTPNPGIISALQSSTNCNGANIIAAGPNTPIEAGALVVVLMSNNTETNYDFDGLCANGETVYILQSECPRTAGAFSNSSSSGCRTYQVFIGDCSNCDSQITYNTSNASNENTSGLGGYAYVFDENGNGQIDFSGGCNSTEIIHNNGIPCQAPPVESIPIPPIPSTIQQFNGYNAGFLDCGEAMQTFVIQGIINPLYDDCIDPFDQNAYAPYIIGPYFYTVEAQAPELTAAPQICVGQSFDLNDLVVDIGQYNQSGWLDNSDPFLANQITTFTPSSTGSYDFFFFPLSSGNGCFTYGCITIEVVDGITPQLGTATICQSETAYDLNQLEDANFTEGTWIVDGGSAVLNDIFNANAFPAGEVTLIFEPTDTGGGCASGTSPSTILTITEGPEITATSANDLGCMNNMTTLSTGATGTGLTYLWEGPGIDASNETLASLDISAPGTYDVTVTDANDCFSVSSVEVMQNTTGLPDVDAQTTGTILCNTLEIQLNGISSVATEYEWTAPDGTIYTDQNPMVSDSGTYVLVVTDAGGCTNSTSLLVEADTMPPTIDILLSNDLSCLNPMASLFGNSPSTNLFDTFQWTLNGMAFSSEQNPQTTEGGQYILAATDLNGCISLDTQTVVIDTISPNVSIEPVVDQITCDNDEIFLEGSSNSPMVSFTWMTPNGVLFGSNPPASSAGTYTLIVGAQNGCTASESVTVEEIITTPIVALTPSTLDCSNTPGMIETASTDILTTYSWEGPNGYTSSSATPNDILAIGTYTLTITDDNGCTNTASTIVSSDDDVPSTSISMPQGAILGCTTSSLTLDAQTEMGNTVEWTFPDMSTSTELSNTVTMEGTYTLTVTASNGCTSTSSVEITSSQTDPTISISQTANLNCIANGTLELSTDGASVVWTLPDMSTTTDMNISTTQEGMYNVVVTGMNGCTATDSFSVVADNQAPIISTITSQDLTCLDLDADLNAVSDISNATFEWLTPSNATLSGASQTVTEEGMYILTVTNPTNGCSITETTMVNTNGDLPNIAIDATQGTTINCTQTNLDLVGSSTTLDVNFEWTTPTTTSTNTMINTDMAGTYSLTVINPDNGCSSTETIEIILDNTSPTLSTQDVVLDCNGTAMNLTSSASSPVEFEWTDENGIFYSNEANPAVTTTGVYNLTVTDMSTGCTASASAMVTGSTDVPDVMIALSNPLDCNNTEAIFTATTSIANPSFEWTDADGMVVSNLATLTANQAGAYTVLITDMDGGCTNTQTEMLVGSADVPDVDISISNATIDCINLESILTATTSIANPIYNWTDASGMTVSSNATFMTTDAGDFNVEITNMDNGCSSTAVAQINGDNTSPTLSTQDVVLDCNGTAMNLTSSASSPVEFEWTDENGIFYSNEANPAVTATGVYNLTVTDMSTGCTASASAMVTGSTDVPDVMIALSNPLDCNNTEATFTATTSIANPSFEWTDADGMVVSNLATLTANQAGAYTVLITDMEGGCTNTQTEMLVGSADIPDVSIDISNSIDCTNSEATLTATTSIANPTYNWTDANGMTVSSNAIFTSTEAGTFNIEITNMDNGCSSMASESIIGSSETPDVSITGDVLIDCINTEVTLTANTTITNPTYNWTDADGLSVSSAMTFTTTQEGMYNVEITNMDNGCSESASESISISNTPPDVVLAVANDIDCTNADATITAITSITNPTFEWTDVNGMSLSNTATYTATAGGDYIVLITDMDSGCTNTEMATVNESTTNPVVNVQSSNPVLDCDNINLVLTGTTDATNATYEWQDENGMVISNDLEITVNEAGFYTLIVSQGACSEQAELEILENGAVPAIDILITGTENIIDCDTDMLELTGSSPENVTYSWTGPNDFTADTPTIMAPESGDYTLTITSISNDCTNAQSFTVFDDFAPPSITATGGMLDCTGTGTTLEGASLIPSASYAWTSDNGFNSTEQNPAVTLAGTYTLVVTSPSNGCTATQSVEVIVDENTPVLMAAANPIDCANPFSVLDGTSSIADSLQWYLDGVALNATNADPNVAEAGIYQLIGINLTNQCTDTLDLEVVLDTLAPMAMAGEDMSINCIQTTAMLDASTSSGQGDLSYEWLNFNDEIIAQSATIEVDSGGPYQIIVTDQTNGCTASDILDVAIDNVQPLVSLMPFGEITCIETSIELDASNSTGTGNLSYEWSNTDGTTLGNVATQTITTAGDYTVQVTNNDNGCSETSLVTVADNIEVPTIAFANPDILTCIVNEVTLDASNSDEGMSFLSEWASPTGATISDINSLMPTVSEAGVYNLSITNTENGCVANEDILVENNQIPPTAETSVSADFGCNTDDVDLFGTGSSEGTSYEYLWTGPSITSADNTLNINVSQAGNYTLLVTNTENGCTNMSSIEVPEGGNSINTSEVLVEDENCAGDDNGLIQIGTIDGGTPPYLYGFNGGSLGQNTQFTNLAPGTYPLLIEDSEGCQWTEDITVAAATPLLIELGDNVFITLGETVDLEIQTASVLDTVIWSETELIGMNPSISPSNTTTINVTATDTNGCTETDAITIFIEKDRRIYIPNAFSPNEDNINDVFMIYGTEAVANISIFNVYDRWGELVFSDSDFLPNDSMHGWDGLFRGKDLNPNVFVYYAEIEFTDGLVEIYKGDVTLTK